MIYSLLYRSQANRSEQQIDTLLRKSRANNERDKITGLLLFKETTFLQLLEGDKETVLKCYKRIITDERHRSAEILLEVEGCPRRLFPEWKMGLIEPDQIHTKLDSLSLVMQTVAASGKIDQQTILAILQSFVKPRLAEAS